MKTEVYENEKVSENVTQEKLMGLTNTRVYENEGQSEDETLIGKKRGSKNERSGENGKVDPLRYYSESPRE